jgi:hypothetical protein
MSISETSATLLTSTMWTAPDQNRHELCTYILRMVLTRSFFESLGAELNHSPYTHMVSVLVIIKLTNTALLHGEYGQSCKHCELNGDRYGIAMSSVH